jgi:PAS domain S-box-containing protein
LRKAHDELEQRVEERTAELVLINENLRQEIVDRQHAEAELKLKIAELNSFINNVPAMAWLKDTESRFIAVNSEFAEAVGMNPESLINHTCEVCFGKEEAKKFREDDQKVMKSTRRVIIEEKITDSQKNEIWLETIKSPIFDESGKVLGTVGIARDITKRKQTQEALRESEKRFRAVVESQTEMICRFLPDGTLTFVNDAYCRYFGKSRKELTGQNLEFLIPEDDRKKVLKNILSLDQNDPIMTHEHRVLNPNGEICWHRWTNRAIFDDQNELLEFQSVGWDITERVRVEKALMESEKRYRLLVETMNEGIGTQDEKGLITYVNNKFSQMLGYKPESLIGKPVTELLDDRNKQILKNQMSIRRKGKVTPYEIEWTSKEGEKIPSIMSPQTILDEKGLFKGSFSVITDISTLKQVEKELRQAHDDLENRVAERTRELKIEKSNLEEANIALQVLLEKRQEDKKETEDNVMTNVKELIAPYVEKIRKTKLNDQQKTFLSIMESNLNEIISPFTRKISLKYLNLTPTEIEVANLVRYGSNSKEIAELMGLSPRTIYNHRKNIRKKFGLENKKTNLRSHLLSTY